MTELKTLKDQFDDEESSEMIIEQIEQHICDFCTDSNLERKDVFIINIKGEK